MQVHKEYTGLINYASKTELRSYDILPHGQFVVAHTSLMNKKWWLGFCFTVLGILLLLYLPVYHQLQTRIGETSAGTVVGIEGWSYNTSRDMKQYVLPDNSTVLQQPTNICQQPLFLLIIVCSSVENFRNRQAVRNSWGSETLVENRTVKVIFLVGQTENQTVQDSLYSEFERHNDIIQERFIDSYNNLTLKSVMMLKWVNNHCSDKTKYIMKSDDDTFVNFAQLIRMLQDYNEKDLLIGALICGARPIANVRSKWYAPKFMYPGRVYPNYLSGSAYLMSTDVVGKLYKAALWTRIFHIEDVFITGICAKNARVKPINSKKFSYLKKKLDPCIFKDLIAIHRIKPKEMDLMYHSLRQQDVIDDCHNQINSTLLTPSVESKKRRVLRKSGCY